MGALITSFPGIADTLPPADCLAGAQSRTVRIAGITDGDSLVLHNGRQLRLIGVNALELHSPAKGERAVAEQARDWLRNTLLGRQTIMIPGRTEYDSYGRQLAHVRLPDGRNAAHALVDQGLALAVAVGGNTRCATSLMSLEKRARDAQRGLWHTSSGWLTAESLSGREVGFHVVTGVVLRVRGTGRRTTLHLSNGLQVVAGRHWPHDNDFNTDALENMTGSKVEVRGWLDTSSGTQRLTLHHPANLQLISN